MCSRKIAEDAMALDVSRETINRLKVFEALLRRWTARINLVAASTLGAFWERHILDSVALWRLGNYKGRWVDLGSGGGLPIIPIAIMAAEVDSSVEFVAVESDQRKAVFLSEASRQLGLSIAVVNQRIENAPDLQGDVISARALADIETLFRLAKPHCAQSAQLLLLKGEDIHSELTRAARIWQFDYQNQRHPLTRRGYILRVNHFGRS